MMKQSEKKVSKQRKDLNVVTKPYKIKSKAIEEPKVEKVQEEREI